jgi:hypothetical protein
MSYPRPIESRWTASRFFDRASHRFAGDRCRILCGRQAYRLRAPSPQCLASSSRESVASIFGRRLRSQPPRLFRCRIRILTKDSQHLLARTLVADANSCARRVIRPRQRFVSPRSTRYDSGMAVSVAGVGRQQIRRCTRSDNLFDNSIGPLPLRNQWRPRDRRR